MRIFVSYNRSGSITAMIKVNAMTAALAHPFGWLKDGETILEVPVTPDLAALSAHQICQDYHVDIHRQQLIKSIWFDLTDPAQVENR